MKKILMYQHQSSFNHGCEALVYSISQQIKEFCPCSYLQLASFYKKDDEIFSFPNVDKIIQNNMWLRRFSFPWFVYQTDKRLFNSKSIQESSMYCKPCYKLAKESDICVAIGGDTYCYNKGKEHWPLERKIKKLGKKMMLWGCSLEPDDIPGEMAEHLNNFDVITARDPITYQALLDNKISSRIIRTADPAFLLPVMETELPHWWTKGKMVGLNFSPMVMGELKNKETYRTAIEKLIEHILETTDDKIVLIPHVRLSFSDDVSELVLFYNKYRGTKRVFLIDDITLNARQLKYLISNCKIFVGARTHATIAAYSTFVPTLSIGYSVKARGIAKDLFGNEEGMTISIKKIGENPSYLLELYDNLYDKKEYISSKLQTIIPTYSKMALTSGDAFKKLLME